MASRADVRREPVQQVVKENARRYVAGDKMLSVVNPKQTCALGQDRRCNASAVPVALLRRHVANDLCAADVLVSSAQHQGDREPDC